MKMMKTNWMSHLMNKYKSLIDGLNEPVLSLRDSIRCVLLGLVFSVVFHILIDSDLPDRINSVFRVASCETSVEDANPDSAMIFQLIDYCKHGVWPKNYTSKDIIGMLKEVKKDQFRRLGVTKDVKLRADDLAGNLAGYYDPANEEIVIDEEVLTNSAPQIALQIICHESYHVAQVQFAFIYSRLSEEEKDLCFFYNAKKYWTEVENYVDCNENTAIYESQWIEMDADNYAQSMIDRYLK